MKQDMVAHIPKVSKNTIVIFFVSVTFVIFSLSSCAKSDVHTVTAVKPKTHKRHYNPGKNKRSKRTKTVKLKNN